MLVYEQYSKDIVAVHSDSNKFVVEQPSGAEYAEVYALGTIENGVAVFKSGFTYVEGNEKPKENENTENVDK